MINFAKKLQDLFKTRAANPEFFDDLADKLIEGDIGAKNAYEITGELEKRCKQGHITDEEAMTSALASLLSNYVKTAVLEPEAGRVSVYLILGVNGVGKTTTAAKLAHYYKKRGNVPVFLAAADTFRAAAIDQLKIHGERLDIRVVAHKDGGDPAAVVFDAAEAAAAAGGGLVIADTAGRLHNKEHLVRELQKIDRIAADKASEGCYKKILVLDGTTGQNALRQTEAFLEAVGIDAVILTKYDSTAKGGAAVSIGKELGVPVIFIGTGETYDDFSVFNPDSYIAEFTGLNQGYT